MQNCSHVPAGNKLSDAVANRQYSVVFWGHLLSIDITIQINPTSSDFLLEYNFEFVDILLSLVHAEG